MARPYTEAQYRAHKKYAESTDEIRYRTRKGRKAEITAHAESMGETLGQFVDRAVDETITRDLDKSGGR